VFVILLHTSRQIQVGTSHRGKLLLSRRARRKGGSDGWTSWAVRRDGFLGAKCSITIAIAILYLRSVRSARKVKPGTLKGRNRGKSFGGWTWLGPRSDIFYSLYSLLHLLFSSCHQCNIHSSLPRPSFNSSTFLPTVTDSLQAQHTRAHLKCSHH
jgi:hypothetical protein